jgi:hypothetical protein
MSRLAALLAALALATGSARAADQGVDVSRTYRVETGGSTATLRVGGQGKLVFFFTPLEPKVHVNQQAPFKARLEGPAGLQLAKAELRRADAVDPKAENPRFEVPFTATAPGRHEARVSLEFYICSDAWCVRQTKTLAIPVDVK